MQQEQLQELFNDLSAALVLYARQWCQAPDDAVQEAFVELFGVPNPPTSPRAWLYTTTRRRAQNIARSEQRRRKHHELADKQRAKPESHEGWFRANETQTIASEVAEALDDLPGDERELLVARIWGELSFEELANVMQCSVSSAHRRYQSALVALKRIVAEEPRPAGATVPQSSSRPHGTPSPTDPMRAIRLAKGDT